MSPDLSWGELAVRLAVAAGLSGAIGLERELRERTAGLRTHILVGVGSALFTVVSAYGWNDVLGGGGGATTFDPTRIAAQVVTGIGFLGAGAIIRHRAGVTGLTTAAGLWVAAAIGMAAGAGFYRGALIATGIVLVGLGPLRWLEPSKLARARPGVATLHVDLRPREPVSVALAAAEALGARAARIGVEDTPDRRSLVLEVELPPGVAPAALVEHLAALDAVTAVRLDA